VNNNQVIKVSIIITIANIGMAYSRQILILLVTAASSILSIESFLINHQQTTTKKHHPLSSLQVPLTLTLTLSAQVPRTFLAMSTSNENETSNTLADPQSMRIREIKDELDGLNVKYDDCFDKESICLRLVDARSGKVKGEAKAETKETKAASEPAPSSAPKSAPTPSSAQSSNFDKDKKLQELRSLRVKELRTKCAQYNIRWATMIEKEELVQALIIHYEKVSTFSPSGTIAPGKVSMITDDSILEKELYSGGTGTAPLMLDVFATWCGPCKLMAPQLDEAAEELGDKIRIAKIDSDLHPEWSSKLNVSGLPTIIVFDGQTGKELQRVEGALMKNDLLNLARSHMN
jgi:thioredoxin 1